jgi:hypothetical protein
MFLFASVLILRPPVFESVDFCLLLFCRGRVPWSTAQDRRMELYGWIGHLKSFAGTRVTVTAPVVWAASTSASDVRR